jgi:hypothetical protein
MATVAKTMVEAKVPRLICDAKTHLAEEQMLRKRMCPFAVLISEFTEKIRNFNRVPNVRNN